MNYIQQTDWQLWKLALWAYNFIASIISKTKISKVRVGQRYLGHIIYPLAMKLLCYLLPEPIEINRMLMYHRARDGRGQSGCIYVFGYEPEVSCLFKQIVRQGMTFVDVGAYIGYYTLLAAKCVGIEGKVYAFEPDPSYYALLVKNIEANNLGKIVEPFNQAIGDTRGKATLYLGRSTGSGLLKTPDATDKTSMADVISLDMFFENQGWPAVQAIKMDIEGSEVLALEGIRQLVKRNPGIKLIIELNPTYLNIAGKTPEGLLTLLSKLGFQRAWVLVDKKSYKIPQDIPGLVARGRRQLYLNLLCEQ